MQDRKNRAAAALSLLKTAMRGDDQNGTDFVASIIQSEELWREYVNDRNGDPFDTMADFVAETEAEEDLQANGINASAARGGRPRRMTGDERYRARMAAMGK